jgi:hypothetical protein
MKPGFAGAQERVSLGLRAVCGRRLFIGLPRGVLSAAVGLTVMVQPVRGYLTRGSVQICDLSSSR